MTANIWILHDKRHFGKLENKAEALCVNLNYGNRSKNIAYHITKAYKLHAEIDDELLGKIADEHAYKKIAAYEKKISNEMESAFGLAKAKHPEKLAFHHARWWSYFLMKNVTKNKIYYLPTFWHLFLEQYTKLNRLIPSLRATSALCGAAISGHNKRSYKVLSKKLEGYWSVVLKNDKRPLMF